MSHENLNKIPAKHNPFAAANVVGIVTQVVGVEAVDVINVALQLKNANGNDLKVRGQVFGYLSDDANGDSITASAPTTVAIGTDGLMVELVADKYFSLTSESDGDIDINIGSSGTSTWYLVIILPDGSLSVSGAITFA